MLMLDFLKRFWEIFIFQKKYLTSFVKTKLNKILITLFGDFIEELLRQLMRLYYLSKAYIENT